MRHNIKFIFITLLTLTLFSCGWNDIKNNTSDPAAASPTLVTSGDNRQFFINRTKFVDQIGENLLYRGSLPIDNKQFVLQEVLDSMVSQESRKMPVNKALVAPNTLPQSNYFIDFNLLTKILPKERADFNVENNFFSQNPKAGELVHHDADVLFAEGILIGKVGKFIDPVIVDLYNQLSKKENNPRIIYVHCEAGLDRTGAIVSGYAMRYLKYSYKDALALNSTLELRNPNSSAQLAIKLYAKYLQNVIGIKTIGNI